MRLVTFDPYRSFELSGCLQLKPDHMFRELAALRSADWVLFPENWQINTLVHALKARIFPSAASYALGFDKIEQTRALLALVPEHLPETLILPSTPSGVEQALATFGLPMVVKEPRSSMGRGVELVEDRAMLRAWADCHTVLYAQEYIPSAADLRVVWVADRVCAAYWRRGGDGFHHNISRGGLADFADPPPAVLELVTQVALTLEIDHAGFDIIMLDDHPLLLELNVKFGHDALNKAGIRLGPIILDYLTNGRNRSPRAPWK